MGCFFILRSSVIIYPPLSPATTLHDQCPQANLKTLLSVLSFASFEGTEKKQIGNRFLFFPKIRIKRTKKGASNTFATALCEDNAVYFCNRAAANTQIHRYAEAVQDCLRSIQIDPNYSKGYSRLGFAYYCQGKYKDAIDKGYMKALQLDPNNESVKENIRVAEQKLREEQQSGGPGQNSTSTSHGYFNFQHGDGSRSNSTPSIPFNINGADLSSMFMNMAGNVFQGQDFQNGSDMESEDGAHDDNEPGARIGGNINFNVNDLPEELSGAFRSMMEMFPGAGAASNGNQQQDNSNNGRSTAN